MDKEKYEKKLWDLAMLQNMIDEHVEEFLTGETDVVWFSAAIGVLDYQRQSLISQLANRMKQGPGDSSPKE